jgi:hypothetical protein
MPRPPEHLGFLLEEPVPTPKLTDLVGHGAGCFGSAPVIHSRATQPLRQRHRLDTEV